MRARRGSLPDARSGAGGPVSTGVSTFGRASSGRGRSASRAPEGDPSDTIERREERNQGSSISTESRKRSASALCAVSAPRPNRT